MNNHAIKNRYGVLSESNTEDQKTAWRKLNAQQRIINKQYSSQAYLKGYNGLGLDHDEVILISDLSQRLEVVTKWTLVPVPGLVPTDEFFEMLMQKIYPVTNTVRGLSELEYSEQPDKFHDIYGHVALLVNQRFNRFLSDFSEMALRYIDNEDAIEYLGRFYWYNFETGLVKEEGTYKVFGGAILTSLQEVENVFKPEIPKKHFNVRNILNAPVDISKLQEHYFYLESFEELFDSLEEVEKVLNEMITN